jgi:hypothetical protein
MKTKAISLVALGLLLGANLSIAQSPPAAQQGAQEPPPAAQTPPTPQPPPNPANPVDPVNPPDPANPLSQGVRPAAPPVPQSKPFGMLDMDENGKLTKEQAGADPWLVQNFLTCDENHNDEVTESEYEKCTRRR